jgi:thiol-disulfide isomerase/thioredoxin
MPCQRARRTLRAGLLSSLLTLLACASWQPASTADLQRVSVRTEVEIWQHDRPFVLHAVQVRADSLGGVPFDLATWCTSCRRVLPLAEIDSLRVSVGPEQRVFFAMALTVGVVLLAIIGLAPRSR